MPTSYAFTVLLIMSGHTGETPVVTPTTSGADTIEECRDMAREVDRMATKDLPIRGLCYPTPLWPRRD